MAEAKLPDIQPCSGFVELESMPLRGGDQACGEKISIRPIRAHTNDTEGLKEITPQPLPF